MVNVCILPDDPCATCLSIPDFLTTLPATLLSSLTIHPTPTPTTEALLWLPNIAQGDTSSELRRILLACPRIRFVQLPMTGVDDFVPLMRELALERDVVWCCAKGCYSAVVAEHALAMSLTLMRNMHLTTSMGSDTLVRKNVWIVGSGAIATALSTLLQPFHCHLTLTDSTTPTSAMHIAIARAEIVFLTCPLTPNTTHLFDRPLLARLRRNSLLINIARPEIIHTPSLLHTLKAGHIRAAVNVIDTSAVDVQDVQKLVQQGRLLVTDHQAVPKRLIAGLLGERLRWNLGVLVGEEGKEEWKGRVDPQKGY